MLSYSLSLWLQFGGHFSSIPLLRNVKEQESERENPRFFQALKQSFNEVYQTLTEVRKYKNVAIFLLAYWFYMDGIDTIVRMATAYGTDIGLEASSMITALILTQFVGFHQRLFLGISQIDLVLRRYLRLESSSIY